jgi:hypothetical protein
VGIVADKAETGNVFPYYHFSPSQLLVQKCSTFIHISSGARGKGPLKFAVGTYVSVERSERYCILRREVLCDL